MEGQDLRNLENHSGAATSLASITRREQDYKKAEHGVYYLLSGRPCLPQIMEKKRGGLEGWGGWKEG